MGCSRSRPEDPSPKTTYQYKPLNASSRLKRSHYGAQDEFLVLYRKLIKWKGVFQHMLSKEGKAQDLPDWITIQIALKKHVEGLEDDLLDEDKVAMQLSTLTRPTALTSYFSTRIGSQSIDPNSGFDEKLSSLQISPSSSCDIDSAQIPQADIINLSILSPKLPAKSRVQCSFELKPSSKQDLKNHFLKQIDKSAKFISDLVKQFIAIHRQIFEQQVFTLVQEDQYTEKHKEVYSSLILTIKYFASVLANFLHWICEEMFAQYKEELDQEFINPLYFIDTIVYELIFKGSKNPLKDMIFSLLRLKYKHKLTAFAGILTKLKSTPLPSYDNEVLKSSIDFLLPLSAQPYSQVTQKLNSIHQEISPFSKLEAVNSLFEEEMWDCVKQYYKDAQNSSQLLIKLKNLFGMEIRFPIMMYCMVQTQNENLIIEQKFMKEFVDSGFLSLSIAYTSFKSGFDQLFHDFGVQDLKNLDLGIQNSEI